jgi:hypothetical protein
MTDLEKRLDKLLKSKNLLHKEVTKKTKKCDLLNTLIEAVDSNYNFKPLQISNFITQISLPKYNNRFMASDEEDHKKIMKYIFMKCDFTEGDLLIVLTNNYIVNDYSKPSIVVDCLIERKCNIPVSALGNIRYYPFFNIDNYDEIHSNVIIVACRSIIAANIRNFEDCLDIIKKKKNHFDINYIEIILTWINTHSFDKNQKLYTELLDVMFDNCCDNKDTILDAFINNKNYINAFLYEYIIEKIGYNEPFVTFMLNSHLRYHTSLFYKLIEKGYIPTVESVNCLLKTTSNVRYGIATKKSIDLFKTFDLQPTIETLNIACRIQYTDEVNILLDEYNVVPEKETLDICVSVYNYNLISRILHYKLTPDEDTLNKITGIYDHQHTAKIIDLLLAHGLVINSTHIETFLKKKIYVNDLERFGITYDEKLYFECYLNNFDGYFGKFTFNPIILQMHSLCKTNRLKLEKLIDFLKTNNIKLDRYALDFLIINNPEISTHFMNKYNCIPSIYTAYKHCKAPQKMLDDIIKNNNITHDEMLKQYDMTIV